MLNEVRGIPGGSNILNTSLAKSKELKLRHDQNTFSFEFTDLDFISDPQDTRVLYQLENYDNSWRPAEDKRTAYYFDLQPGRYLFRVKAINAEGIEAIKEIAVIIHPPWWKTTWAYIGFAMIAAIAAVGLYLNGVKQLTAKQAEQVRLMVATQEDERKRISRDLHDDVGTKLSALKLSLSSLGEKARNIDNQES